MMVVTVHCSIGYTEDRLFRAPRYTCHGISVNRQPDSSIFAVISDALLLRNITSSKSESCNQ